MLRHAATKSKSTTQGSLLQSHKGSKGKGLVAVGLYQLKRSAISILAFSICVWGMRSLSLFSRPAHGKSPPPLAIEDPSALRARAESALWSFFAGDALSSPTHWFYGGSRQIQQYYGAKGITGYTKPSYELQGSILNKSNLSGGGRSGSKSNQQTIIGNVINHGKANLWSSDKSIHYHATLASGEPTLEAQIGRVLMRSIAENSGQFNADRFRQAYVDFMTTPGSHNDTYASTCHRMFFANYHYKKLDPKDCPDNDKHNVDTIDGLVLPTITALAVAARGGTQEEAAQEAAATAAVTRRSDVLESYASAWGSLIYGVVSGSSTATSAAQDMARQLRLPTPRAQAKMTACYLDSAVPAMLDMIVGSSERDVFESLLVNANAGGENVHRGSCLGAVMGAIRPLSPAHREGLVPHDAIAKDIDGFLDSIFTSEI